ncbi:MAG: flavin reductase family protein [Paucimonas sp.]|nr:flavin reductase family protein [Paucimonas sp.]
MDTPGLRRMLGQFATGVAVVSARNGDSHECVTVNSFNSVSLDPPLVLFSLHHASSALASFENGSHYGISILDEGNRELSRLFAGRERHRWKECNVEPGHHGGLLVKGAVARMECERWAVYDGGDHRIFVCKVLAFDYNDNSAPLLYFRGRYCALDGADAQEA